MTATADITRGTSRLLVDLGFAPLCEVPLKNGRRLDILAIGPKSELVAVEVKSSRQDFLSDCKWQDYLEFCDRFYFAVTNGFPLDILPEEEGLIIADRFGAEIARPSNVRTVPAARRRAMLLKVARLAALRICTVLDPRPEQDLRL